MKIRGRRCFRRRSGTTHPDTHPDAWETIPVPEEARQAPCVGRCVIGGREHLLFGYGDKPVWAMNVNLLPGADGGASNFDPEQAAEHEADGKAWTHG